MNCFRNQLLLLLVLWAASLFNIAAHGQTVLDNFNEYTQTSGTGLYIQGSSNSLPTAQQGTNGKWLRFGSGISDGLYSSSGAASTLSNPGGGTNRGVVADSVFNGSTETQYIPEFFFTSPFDLSNTGSCSITLDIKTGTVLANLNVYLQIQDANGEQYQSAALSLATDSTYTTYTFGFYTGSGYTQSIAASPVDTLATVLASATELNIVFKDTSDSASSAIDFDNLVDISPVPEPSLANLTILGAIVGFGFRRLLRRRRLPSV